MSQMKIRLQALSLLDRAFSALTDDELGPVLKAKRRRYFTARFIHLLPQARDQVGIEITPSGSGDASRG